MELLLATIDADLVLAVADNPVRRPRPITERLDHGAGTKVELQLRGVLNDLSDEEAVNSGKNSHKSTIEGRYEQCGGLKMTICGLYG